MMHPWGPCGSLLEGPGGILGVPWAPLGAPWGVLEGPWGFLGDLLGVLCAPPLGPGRVSTHAFAFKAWAASNVKSMRPGGLGVLMGAWWVVGAASGVSLVGPRGIPRVIGGGLGGPWEGLWAPLGAFWESMGDLGCFS